MSKFDDLKKLMLAKGFVFENYGKFIKKDSNVLCAAGKNVTKEEALYSALDTFFRINNFKWIMKNPYTADFEAMLKNLEV